MNFDQLRTIVWLRWRLTRNQWTRSRGLGAVITALVTFAMVVLASLSFVGGLLGGLLGLSKAKPMVILGVWSGVSIVFLFIWLVGLLNELQRSETIDLQRLMHLPVLLGQIFVINYLASHLTFSIVLAVPGMVGLAAGLVLSRGARMLLLVPLCLSMVFMVSAWTYLLRGWLATLMSNPRRRRAVIMGITFAFVLIAQAPNLFFNVFGSRHHPAPAASSPDSSSDGNAQKAREQKRFEQLLAAQKFIPPLWVAVGAGGLAEGRVLPAVWGTLGCLALGALGLRRAYVTTVRFYHGDTGSKYTGSARSKAPVGLRGAESGAKPEAGWVQTRIPGVPEQAAALALATFRSMLRAPEVKMAWASSFLVTLILAVSFLLRGAPKVPEMAKPFIATGAVMFSVFMLVQFYANQFGFDRDGFRALVLSPVQRRFILLGKNLACLPVGGGFGLLLLLLITVFLRLSPIVVLAALLQLISLFLMAGLIGNLLSILAPYRIQPGSMKPTKMPALAMLLMVACHLFFPLMMLPALVPPLLELLWRQTGGTSGLPLNLLLSAALAGLLGFIYWQTLEPMGRLLQRRETRILQIVTVEVE